MQTGKGTSNQPDFWFGKQRVFVFPAVRISRLSNTIIFPPRGTKFTKYTEAQSFNLFRATICIQMWFVAVCLIRIYSWAVFLYGHVLVQWGSGTGQKWCRFFGVPTRFAQWLTNGLHSPLRNRVFSLFVLVSEWTSCLLPKHKLGDFPCKGSRLRTKWCQGKTLLTF